jgi:hypothetical protein
MAFGALPAGALLVSNEKAIIIGIFRKNIDYGKMFDILALHL